VVEGRAVELRDNLRASLAHDLDRIDLSIVLPAYNESRRIQTGLEVLLASIERGELGSRVIEIIVVDDGCSDSTAADADRLLASFPRRQIIRLPENRGKGAAIRAGVARARGEIVTFMDVDMAVHPSQLPRLIAALDDADVAIGSRALPQSNTECDSRLRTTMGRSFTLLVKVLTRLSLSDTQCGFKAYRTPVARILFHCSTINRFAFDVEVLSVAQRLGFRVAEVPVHWRHMPESRIRPLVDSTSMLTDLIKSVYGGGGSPDLRGIVVPDTPLSSARFDSICTVLGPTIPIIPWGDSDLLVLLPLCEVDEIQDVFLRVEKCVPDADLSQISLTPVQLQAIDPLSVRGSCSGPFDTTNPEWPATSQG
jgi:dolichyl-phosphate beta-glucosyltransferase